MKSASVNDIKKELKTLPHESLVTICLRLAKFKAENKELLTYLLFEAEDLPAYVASIKAEIDEAFADIHREKSYLAKKKLRKIIRITNKYIRYVGDKETEADLLLYICQHMKDAHMVSKRNLQIHNIYMQLLKKSVKAIDTLHEDLQYEYIRMVNGLDVDV
ncbi:hypothetical protein SAMN05444266_109361 [Chitinophaga jiangningensis]|uniref:Uncharacterized protein n=1 Tax=Chitinophaga jiangningensis TaxID=1419482 RepID=A0A1M7KJH7_9BACT|nr:hypothetical protein [Chitinophaga jiangningensis]SHM65423.1 hypothetical protein SAMN05444266_109361 [Chitinophaga jiangningensis]